MEVWGFDCLKFGATRHDTKVFKALRQAGLFLLTDFWLHDSSILMFSDYIPSNFARSSAAILKFLLDAGLVRSVIARKNIKCRYNTPCR